MEEVEIINLYISRSETAIHETAKKYGNYCEKIAYGILKQREDAEECVNETYLRAWNTIPPQHPQRLSAYLGKITRNLALDRYNWNNSKKRGGDQVQIALSELEDCMSTGFSVEQDYDYNALVELINMFLNSIPTASRMVSIRRYWYFDSISDISNYYTMRESKVKSILFRTRNQLKSFLEKEGIAL